MPRYLAAWPSVSQSGSSAGTGIRAALSPSFVIQRNLFEFAVSSRDEIETYGEVVTVTVTVSALMVTGASVRTDVCVPAGGDESSVACPIATPTAKTTSTAAARRAHFPAPR